MKPLYLLSFSLAFLSQGIANDFAYEEETREQYMDEEYDDQEISFDDDDDDYLSDAEQPDYSTFSDQSQDCLSPYHRMHVSARHNENKGIGYHDGYTTLEAFGIYDGWSSHFMPFLDLRGHVFNNGKLAGNVGIGERTVISSWSHTFGSYLYYDVRRVGHGLTINQLSPGLELVGRRMEYRINGYFPLGKDKTRKYHRKFDEFEGHNIILKSRQQRALRGGDAEVGVHVTQSTKYDLYAAAGPYYIHAPHAHSWGGRTRLVGRYKEYVSLEVAYSYDTLFRSIVQGSVAVTLPFGRKLKRTGQGCPQGNDLLLSRASFAPSRFEIPVVKRIRRKEKAINPATGKPWTVWFVNNTSHSTGTYESPFPALLQAQNASSTNDMIYVFPGDGTTTGMNAGITLKNGQSLFGSGISHKIHTSKGKITIPKFSKTFPTITNTTGSIVTLKSGNEVSGFNLVAGKVDAESVLGVSGTRGANINNNVFSGTLVYTGIFIQGSGKVLVKNNQLIGIPANAEAIRLTVDDSQTMTGETSHNQSSGFFFGIGMNVGNNATANYQIAYNTVTGASHNAIFWGGPGFGISSTKGTIIGNRLSSSQPVLAIFGNSLFGSMNVTDNSITAYAQDGIFLDIRGTSNLSCNLQGNTIAQSSGVGFFGVNARTIGGTPTLNLSLIDNTNSGGFSLVGTTGTFNVGPIEGNTGPITATNVNFVD